MSIEPRFLDLRLRRGEQPHLGKLVIREWAINLGTAKGLGWAAEHAVKKDSPWANKAAHVLRYLNSQLDAPITAP